MPNANDNGNDIRCQPVLSDLLHFQRSSVFLKTSFYPHNCHNVMRKTDIYTHLTDEKTEAQTPVRPSVILSPL